MSTEKHTPKYPEHEKLKRIADQSQTIGEFLDWANSKKGYTLAGYDRLEILQPMKENTEQILAEYFQIDLDKIEVEKRQMIASCQK